MAKKIVTLIRAKDALWKSYGELELDYLLRAIGELSYDHCWAWEMAEADVPIRFSPIFWRARAEEARTVAEGLNHDVAKLVLLRIAEDYERLAEWFEDGSKATFPRPNEPKVRVK